MKVIILHFAELDSLPTILKTYFRTVLKENAPKPNFITLGQTAFIKN